MTGILGAVSTSRFPVRAETAPPTPTWPGSSRRSWRAGRRAGSSPASTRISALVDLLGAPHRAFPVVQVTGTNGKTTTARMIDELLRGFGLRVGRFTSPHLESMRERIVLDGEPLTAERFVEVYEDIAPYVQLVDAEQRRPDVLLRGDGRRWPTPRSPTPRSTSPSSRSAWAAPGTRPTSPTPGSPSSPRSPSTTPSTWGPTSRPSPPRRPGSSSPPPTDDGVPGPT